MHRAKRIKFELSVAKTRAVETNKCLEQIEAIEEAAKALRSVQAPSLPAKCCESSVELLLVATLGLKGVECL